MWVEVGSDCCKEMGIRVDEAMDDDWSVREGESREDLDLDLDLDLGLGLEEEEDMMVLDGWNGIEYEMTIGMGWEWKTTFYPRISYDATCLSCRLYRLESDD